LPRLLTQARKDFSGEVITRPQPQWCYREAAGGGCGDLIPLICHHGESESRNGNPRTIRQSRTTSKKPRLPRLLTQARKDGSRN